MIIMCKKSYPLIFSAKNYFTVKVTANILKLLYKEFVENCLFVINNESLFAIYLCIILKFKLKYSKKIIYWVKYQNQFIFEFQAKN